MKKPLLMLVLLGLGLAGCSSQEDTSASVAIERWYDEPQVLRGNVLFQANCASCHKPDASGASNWREADARGKYPPPPLNGTAHTWHHPLSILRRTVGVGGVPLGGNMPGFADKLSDRQIDDILAWVQSHWSDDIYRIWRDRDAQSNRR